MNKPNKKPETNRGTGESGGESSMKKNQISKNFTQAAIDYHALKTSFISNISHEIRTPLNAILGFSELSLQNSADLNEMLDYMKIIHNSSNDLLQKIKDIIYVSSLDADMVNYQPDTISMDGLMKELQDYYNFFYPKQERGKAEILVNTENTIHFYFVSDAAKLVDVLKRLMSNAIKFTHEGEVSLSVDISNPNEVCFVVKDSGIGIPNDKLEIIFEPFASAQDLYSRSYNGSGLGLTIVRHLVALIKGRLEIDSELDKGTEVRVSIPYTHMHKT